MPRRPSRGGTGNSDSDDDYDPEVTTSKDEEVVEVQEPKRSAKRPRAVRIDETDSDDTLEKPPAPKRKLLADPNTASGSRPVRAVRASRGKPAVPLALRRGIRDPSPSSSDYGLDVTVRSSGGQRGTARKNTTRQTETTPGSAERRHCKWTTKVHPDHFVDEDEWEYGTMTNRPAFYDRRPKNKLVNTEKVSDDSGPGSDMSDFLADSDSDSDEEEDEDKDKDKDKEEDNDAKKDTDEDEDEDEDRFGRIPRRGRVSRKGKAIVLGSDDSDGSEKRGRKKDAPKPSLTKKPRLRRKSNVHPSPVSDSDDLPSPGRARSRLKRNPNVLQDDDDVSAPAPASASGFSDLADAGAKTDQESLKNDNETPVKKSARLSSRRENKSAECSRQQKELEKGMRRTLREIEDAEHEDLGRLEDPFADVDDLAGFVAEDGEDGDGYEAGSGEDETQTREKRGDAKTKAPIGNNGWVRYLSDDSDEQCGDASDDDDETDLHLEPHVEKEWVYCECGVCENDDSEMLRCCNKKCRAWQHVACVDVDSDSWHRGKSGAFFCACCAIAGGRRAPTPPGKRPGVGANGNWASRLRTSFVADDEKSLVATITKRDETAPPRRPSRRALLTRASMAGALKCLSVLLGGPWTNDARDRFVDDAVRKTFALPRASTDAVAATLHVALHRGDVGAVETIRTVLGGCFSHPPNSGPERRWAWAAGRRTLVHSAADNAAADPRCVWLALEAEGEAPRDEFGGGFDHAACPLMAARAAGDVTSGALANVSLDSVAAHPLRHACSSGAPDAALGGRASRYAPIGDRPLAAARDDQSVTPLMLAADGGPGWEGCVAALLRSAAAFAADNRFTKTHGAVGVTLFDPTDSAYQEKKLQSAYGVADTQIFKGAGTTAIIRDQETGSSAAHYAARAGAVASLRLLRAAHPGSVRALDAEGATPTHIAAAYGHAECVRVLVDELGGSRVATDARGWIPLMYADFASDFHSERGNGGWSGRSAALVLMQGDLLAQLRSLRVLSEDAMSIPCVKRVVTSLAENPACYEALNAFLRSDPRLLDPGAPLEFLLSLSFGKPADTSAADTSAADTAAADTAHGMAPTRTTVVDFPNRREWLARTLRSESNFALSSSFQEYNSSANGSRLTLTDSQAPWADLFKWARLNGPGGWRNSPLHHHMRSTTHIASGPGPERDLMESLAKELSGDGVHEGLRGESLRAENANGNENENENENENDTEKGAPFAPLLTRAECKSPVYRPFHLPEVLPVRVETAFVIFGQLLGYAIAHKSPLPVALATSFVRGVLGRETGDFSVRGTETETETRQKKRHLEELAEMDPLEAKSLAWILDAPGEEVEAACLPFSLEETLEETEVTPQTTAETTLGDHLVSERVTAKNRNEYVYLRAARQVARVETSSATRATRRGFTTVIPTHQLAVFSTAECALMLGGCHDVSVTEMRASCKLEGYCTTHETPPQPAWLFRFLERASTDERALFLKFVTGSSRLPPGGFDALEYPLTVVSVPLSDIGLGSANDDSDNDGDARVGRAARAKRVGFSAKINKPVKLSRYPLPTSATCFNQLRLPEYPTEQVLHHRIATALRHGVEGFGFA